jgi:hypothetical protein
MFFDSYSSLNASIILILEAFCEERKLNKIDTKEFVTRGIIKVLGNIFIGK